MRTLISMVPLLSGCLLTGEQYDIKYDEMFPDAVEADTADSTDLTLQSVTLSSDPMFTNSTLTATAEAINTSDEMVDITDQQVTFEWHVIDADTNQDTVVQTDESNTLDGTLFFDKDDQVYAVATFGAVSVTSDTILVYNSPPTTPSINITPSSPVAGQDDVACNVTVESTDADNDPVTYNYEWLDSTGETIQQSNGVAELSDVLSAELTTAGPLTCSVTPLSVDYVGISEFAIVDVGAGECSGMLFDNVDDVIGVSDVSLPTEHTVEAWVYWYGNTSEVWQYILEQNFFGGDSAMRLSIRNTDGFIRIGTANNIGPTYALPANEWVLVSSTFSSATSTSTLYINGTKVETVLLEHSPSTGDLSIGGLVENNLSSGYTFNGVIHSVRMSNTVKYTQDFEPGTLTLETDTVGLWVFSDMESSSVDLSGINDAGIILGEPDFVNTCPQEDLDGDGVESWEDCDDGDASLSDDCLEFDLLSCGEAGGCCARDSQSLELICWGELYTGTIPNPTGSIEWFDVSGNYVIAKDTAGIVSFYGQDECESSIIPTTASDLVQVDAGEWGMCGIDAVGQMTCWGGECAAGCNASGQYIAQSGEWRTVSSGSNHSCAINTLDQMTCWGCDDNGQSSPPDLGVGWKFIRANHAISVGIDMNGGLNTWGNDNQISAVPQGTFESAECFGGNGGCCAIHDESSPSSKELECWGPDTNLNNSPSGNYLQLALGGGQSGAMRACALKTTGSITCWGDASSSMVLDAP